MPHNPTSASNRPPREDRAADEVAESAEVDAARTGTTFPGVECYATPWHPLLEAPEFSADRLMYSPAIVRPAVVGWSARKCCAWDFHTKCWRPQ